MLTKSSCPICLASLPIHFEVCGSCGTYTHRLPENASSRQAALFLELQSKWRPEGRFENEKCKHSAYGICWSPDLKKFISVYGVRSQFNIDVANGLLSGKRLNPFDSPLYAIEIATAKLQYIGGVPTLHDRYRHITEISDWLSNAPLTELKEVLASLRKRSSSALPKFSDVALAAVFTIGSLGLGYKTLGGNRNRDEAAETADAVEKAIRLKFEGVV